MDCTIKIIQYKVYALYFLFDEINSSKIKLPVMEHAPRHEFYFKVIYKQIHSHHVLYRYYMYNIIYYIYLQIIVQCQILTKDEDFCKNFRQKI